MNKHRSLAKGMGGQSLFEIIVAVAISALIVGSTMAAIIVSLRSGNDNVTAQKAYGIARDILDNVRSFGEGDWATLYNLSKGSSVQYYLSITATSATSSTIGITSGTEDITFSSSYTEENVNYTT